MNKPTGFLEKSYDPYDPWMGPRGVAIRDAFYKGKFLGKVSAAIVVLLDWLFPNSLRLFLKVQPRNYPITVAQKILAAEQIDQPQIALAELMSTSVPDKSRFGNAWGLGFPWMSKNGLYNEHVPFITHTPYAMEALCKLMNYEICRDEATRDFFGTWQFMQSLLILHEDADTLALSYAPIDEPRIVINANTYACFAYCLHSQKNPTHKDEAKSRAIKIAKYVVGQQQENGSWYYYADKLPGNFIDCFHSCFVIKNLIKASKLDAEIELLAREAIAQGKEYIDKNFFDEKTGLVKRFTERDIKDPFIWDLYDQAEYLGILIDLSEFERADQLRKAARSKFCRDDIWYSKIDFLGRRWGKNFSRWGITPFEYSESKLKKSGQGNK